jgi:PAS domain S-box-containing protein
VAATLAAWQTIHHQDIEQIWQTTRLESTIARNAIFDHLQTRVLALSRMASRVEHRTAMPTEEWEADAAQFIRQIDSLESIRWVDRWFRVRGAVPPAPHPRPGADEASIDELLCLSLAPAGAGDEVAISRFVELEDGRKGFFVCVPIIGARGFEGFIVAAFDLKALIDTILGEKVAPQYDVAILDASGSVYQRDAGAPTPAEWTFEHVIPVHGATWHMRIWPTPELLAEFSPLRGSLAALAIGLAMSLLLALAVRLAQISQARARELEDANRLLRSEIGERLRVEEALRASEARFRSVAQSANEPIIMADGRGIITDWNRAAQDMFGYTADEALGRPLSLIIPERYREAHRRGLERVSTGGESRLVGRAVELYGLKKDGGEVPVELSLSRWTMGGEPYYGAILHDVTRRRRAEERMRSLNVQLEELVRERTAELRRSNEELQQFASVASHDLQEPLRMVANFVQLLARRYEGLLGKDADEFIGFAVEGVKRMQSLIRDLLDYSRLGRQPAAEWADCGAICDRAILDLGAAIQDSGALVSRGDLPKVEVDGTLLQQVFQNLIGNAIKFRGGRRPEIRVQAERRDGEWLFSVRDNGIGIDPSQAQRIFVIFQRLHAREEYPGTGVGLAICKKVVERHSGRIWVESEPGRGSTFLFTLPVARAAPVASLREAPPATDASMAKEGTA